jgi:hypothetical protein
LGSPAGRLTRRNSRLLNAAIGFSFPILFKGKKFFSQGVFPFEPLARVAMVKGHGHTWSLKEGRPKSGAVDFTFGVTTRAVRPSFMEGKELEHVLGTGW